MAQKYLFITILCVKMSRVNKALGGMIIGDAVSSGIRDPHFRAHRRLNPPHILMSNSGETHFFCHFFIFMISQEFLETLFIHLSIQKRMEILNALHNDQKICNCHCFVVINQMKETGVKLSKLCIYFSFNTRKQCHLLYTTLYLKAMKDNFNLCFL